MSKKSEKEAEKQEAIKTLRQFGVKPGATIYTNVTHVSSSGMSRNIRCYIVTRDTRTERSGEKTRKRVEHGVHDITGLVATACGFSRARGSRWDIQVGGCGMDMCFHVVYTLGRVMFPKGGKLELSPREHQERRDGKTRETDGGYLLRKRDLLSRLLVRGRTIGRGVGDATLTHNRGVHMDMKRYLAGVYRSIRAMGYPANDAIQFARIELRWDELGGVVNEDSDDDACLRLRFEPEHESYEDVYGKFDSEKEKRIINAMIDRDGMWWCVAEARATPDDPWEQADSLGMIIGINPELDGYGWMLKDAAIEKLAQLRDDKATELAEQIGRAATYAAGEAAASSARTSARLSAMADDS